MRRVVTGLIVAFALLQFISYTACACDTLCGHKNACERDEADDCCKHQGSVPQTPCFHLEPQSDVDVLVVDSVDVPTLILPFEVPALLPLPAPLAPPLGPIGLPPPYLEPFALLI